MQENKTKTLLIQAFILGVILYIIYKAIENINPGSIAFTPLIEVTIGNLSLLYAIQLAIIGLFAFTAGLIAPVQQKRYVSILSPFLVVMCKFWKSVGENVVIPWAIGYTQEGSEAQVSNP
ncbi:hypothetical protein [Dictyobacter kobayashii]|uniref:Uncharacterized protein n=1 Tax=Dictyobacter kobayashii TaxID=2014872 RepID=A0A402ASJ3_9CHLR|nr:hypothetical protein [Dictyobacter kobayashii]GCE22057.1 hypothetical protein KDK_58570 [Dictyobacter kobayashii]